MKEKTMKCMLINGDDKIDVENSLRFFLTNARSLKPKINLLVDAFDSLKLHFVGITESCFKGGGGKSLTECLDNIEG